MRSHFRQVNQLFVSFSTKQLIVIALIVCVYWAYTWWNLSSLENRSSAQLKEEILLLSEQYVQALAREHKDLVDGPYAGRLTAYDLKRTMAVLLQNILDRLGKLENKLSNATVILVNESSFVPLSIENEMLKSSRISKEMSSTRTMMSRGVRSISHIAAADSYDPQQKASEKKDDDSEAASKGQASWCGLDQTTGKMPSTILSLYPECAEKLQWMRKYWKSNACYANYGVDGSECSFYIYLSEIEAFCPKLPLRKKTLRTNSTVTRLRLKVDAKTLIKTFGGGLQGPYAANFVERLREAWRLVLSAARSLTGARLMSRFRPKLRIVVYPTLLISKRPFFPKLLNEETRLYMVRQWAELTASLYLLGHEVSLCSSEEELRAILRRFPDASSPCQARRTMFVDLLYTDYPGVGVFRSHLGQNLYQRFSCLLRVLDPFSTQPFFTSLVSSPSCTVCGSELNPKQFLTASPSLVSPDNTFLGHIVDFNLSSSAAASSSLPIAVLHLSQDSPQPPAGLVASLRRHYKLIAAAMDNAATSQLILDDEWRRGLTWNEYRKLLSSAELFVGVGWPLETPLAVEALAEGCTVIGTAKPGKMLSQVMPGWPSNRQVGTQFQYLRRQVGPPLVVDIGEEEESSSMGVEKLIQKIRKSGEKPKKGLTVKEFGAEAFLVRLEKHVRKQDFCEGGRDSWPPSKAISYYLGVVGDSCEETCRKRDLICEPAHFAGINSRIELLERGLRCERIAFDASPVLPNFLPEKETCAFQSEPKMFSCAEGSVGRMRICPCRDYLPDQSALCSLCL